MPIFLGWRTDSIAPRNQIADYLDRVTGHLTADASVIARIGQSNEHHARHSSWGRELRSQRITGHVRHVLQPTPTAAKGSMPLI
jgi:hypothetical protein